MSACPACGEELQAVGPAEERAAYRSMPRGRVMGCPVCGGVWADTAASQRVAAAIDPEIIAAAAEAEDHAAMLGASLPDDSRPRACPECGGALGRVRSAGTTVDACARHGTWFDRGELGKVARALEHARRLKDPTWRSSDDMRWVSGKTALNEGKPELDASTEDDDDLDFLVKAIVWMVRRLTVG